MRTEICGNIASGKTTHLKNSDCKHPIFEDFIKNPFLIDFYKKPTKYSFETEITFLLQHYKAIKDVMNQDIPFMCDFSLASDRAYANVTLSTIRKNLFNKIADNLEDEIGLPQKIIYLKCPVDILLDRIKKRHRTFELNITREYLNKIEQSIKKQINSYSDKTEIVYSK